MEQHPQTMYNLTVAQSHTFFVGRQQLLVHNMCPSGGGLTLGQITKSIRSLERRIAEHEQKLADYIANPDAYNNQGLLRNAPNEQVRQQIIDGRIRKLQGDINNWRSEIENLRGLLSP